MNDLNKISHFSSLQDAITELYGNEVRLESSQAMYGGDINEAKRIDLSNGERIFLKTNTLKKIDMFQAEALGLKILAMPGILEVPHIFGIVEDQERGFSGLLMEYLSPAKQNKDYWKNFGKKLAQLHMASCQGIIEKRYGFLNDNYIGLSPQKNEPKESWIDFFRDCRLRPQIKMADHLLDLPMKRDLDYLLDHLDRYLWEPDQASILHGDLWSGNAVTGPDGEAWLIDPATYLGDAETDLAMTQLFGGFPAIFYESYHSVKPIDSAYRDRKKIYQLYHLLNHVNLFGRSYLWDVADLLAKLR